MSARERPKRSTAQSAKVAIDDLYNHRNTPIRTRVRRTRKTKVEDLPNSIVGTIEESVESGAAETRRRLAKLLHWDELEEWQRDNHFILSGYVPSSQSFRDVFNSLSYIHNETGNIYSHLLPAAIILVALLAIYDRAIPIDHAQARASDHFAFLVNGASFVACLSMSATFHTLKSHSQKVMAWSNKLDYLGICVQIAGSIFALVQFGYHDKPYQRNLFWAVTGVLGIICATISIDPKFKTPALRPFRATMFVLYGLSGALPVLTGFYLFGVQETYDRVGLQWVFAEAGFYIFGAFLYGILFPERFLPGRFDIWGHSHQLFHLMVLIAGICHFKALIEAFNNVVTQRLTTQTL